MKINYYDATMIRYKEKADEILTELPEFVKAFIDDCRGKTDLKELYWVMLQILKPFLRCCCRKILLSMEI